MGISVPEVAGYVFGKRKDILVVILDYAPAVHVTVLFLSGMFHFFEKGFWPYPLISLERRHSAILHRAKTIQIGINSVIQ